MGKNLDQILEEFNSCIPLFATLLDENRQNIIIMLAKESNGLNVNMITEKTSLSRPAISHHLKVLKQTGFVGIRKLGKENYYYLIIKRPLDKIKQLINSIEGTEYYKNEEHLGK